MVEVIGFVLLDVVDNIGKTLAELGEILLVEVHLAASIALAAITVLSNSKNIR